MGSMSALALLMVFISSVAAYPQQVYSATYRPGPTTAGPTTAMPPTTNIPTSSPDPVEPTTLPPKPTPIVPDTQALMGMMMSMMAAAAAAASSAGASTPSNVPDADDLYPTMPVNGGLQYGANNNQHYGEQQYNKPQQYNGGNMNYNSLPLQQNYGGNMNYNNGPQMQHQQQNYGGNMNYNNGPQMQHQQQQNYGGNMNYNNGPQMSSYSGNNRPSPYGTGSSYAGVGTAYGANNIYGIGSRGNQQYGGVPTNNMRNWF